MGKLCLVVYLLFASHFCFAKDNIKPLQSNFVDSIFVSKSKKLMLLYQGKKLYKAYNISVGDNPIGHKQMEGDNRTPEGLYYITDKNANSRYYKNLGISYPNAQDIKRAAKLGLKPGGEIKIHGYADNKGSCNYQTTMFSATWGCIAVCNRDMKEIFSIVKVGSSIFIAP